MLKPLSDRIVLSIDKVKEETTSSGIVLPVKEDKLRSVKATVISVGPGARMDNGEIIPVSVSQGNKVVIDKFSGTDVSYEGEDYKIVREADILAVIEN